MKFLLFRNLNFTEHFLDLFRGNYELYLEDGKLTPFMIGDIKDNFIEPSVNTNLEKIKTFCPSKILDANKLKRCWRIKPFLSRVGDVIQIGDTVFEVTQRGFREIKQEPIVYLDSVPRNTEA